LTYVNKQDAAADASPTLTVTPWMGHVGRVTFPDAVQSGQIKVAGQAEKVIELFSLFDTFSQF
jgi:hypothetical protein